MFVQIAVFKTAIFVVFCLEYLRKVGAKGLKRRGFKSRGYWGGGQMIARVDVEIKIDICLRIRCGDQNGKPCFGCCGWPSIQFNLGLETKLLLGRNYII